MTLICEIIDDIDATDERERCQAILRDSFFLLLSCLKIRLRIMTSICETIGDIATADEQK